MCRHRVSVPGLLNLHDQGNHFSEEVSLLLDGCDRWFSCEDSLLCVCVPCRFSFMNWPRHTTGPGCGVVDSLGLSQGFLNVRLCRLLFLSLTSLCGGDTPHLSCPSQDHRTAPYGGACVVLSLPSLSPFRTSPDCLIMGISCVEGRSSVSLSSLDILVRLVAHVTPSPRWGAGPRVLWATSSSPCLVTLQQDKQLLPAGWCPGRLGT